MSRSRSPEAGMRAAGALLSSVSGPTIHKLTCHASHQGQLCGHARCPIPVIDRTGSTRSFEGDRRCRNTRSGVGRDGAYPCLARLLAAIETFPITMAAETERAAVERSPL